jgi:hypothetical protein
MGSPPSGTTAGGSRSCFLCLSGWFAAHSESESVSSSKVALSVLICERRSNRHSFKPQLLVMPADLLDLGDRATARQNKGGERT